MNGTRATETCAVDGGIPPLGAPPLYLPFADGPFRMAMGLVAQPASALTEIDSHYPAQMALRRQLLAERPAEVFAALPGSAPARAEVLAVLAAHLATDHPGWFAREGDRLANRLTGENWDLARPPCDPLELAGRLVQEDLCVLEPSADGPRLIAAVLCFPSRWRLADKIGRPMLAIHAPVPLYAEKLAGKVDRFMALLGPSRLVERVNWSIHDDPTLFQPAGHGRTEADPAITAANAGARLTLRVERQTLSRLPESGAILFTIRTHQRGVDEIAALPGVAARLAGAIRALPPEMERYKSVQPFRAALLDFLDRRSSGNAGA